MAAPLNIPAAAIVALASRGYDPDDDASTEQINDDVRSIAAPVVAAELRRLASLLAETDDARILLARAGELDGTVR